jgi:hypothetical protein
MLSIPPVAAPSALAHHNAERGADYALAQGTQRAKSGEMVGSERGEDGAASAVGIA